MFKKLYKIPNCSRWFSWDEIHELERNTLNGFFNATSITRTPKIYKEHRDFVVCKYREDCSRRLTFSEGVEDGVPYGIKVVGNLNSLKAVVVPSVVGNVGGGEGKVSGLASYWDRYEEGRKVDEKLVCGGCKGDCYSGGRYEYIKDKNFVICLKCFQIKNCVENKAVDDFKFSDCTPGNWNIESSWSGAETLLLLDSALKYEDDWELVAQHVQTKSKHDCISKLIQLPFGELMFGFANVRHGLWDMNDSRSIVKKVNVDSSEFLDITETVKVPLSDAGNDLKNEIEQNGSAENVTPLRKRLRIVLVSNTSSSLMKQVSRLSTIVGPHITSSASEAAVAALCFENLCPRGIFEVNDDGSRNFGSLQNKRQRVSPAKDSDMDGSYASGTSSNSMHCKMCQYVHGWFSWDEIHELERNTLNGFFNATSITRTPKIYKEHRDFVVCKYREDCSRRLTFSEGVEDGVPYGIKVVGNLNSLKAVVVPSVVGNVGGGEGKVSGLASYWDRYEEGRKVDEKLVCGGCKGDCYSGGRYEYIKDKNFVICLKCFQIKNCVENKAVDDFKFSDCTPGNWNIESSWSGAETLLLLDSALKYEDDWELVAQHVQTKSKHDCISKLIQLPFGELMFGFANVRHGLWDMNDSRSIVKKVNVDSSEFLDITETVKVPLSDAGNDLKNEIEQNGSAENVTPLRKRLRIVLVSNTSSSLMKQVSRLSTIVGPHITSSASEAAVAALCFENLCPRGIFEVNDDGSRNFGSLQNKRQRVSPAKDSDMDGSYASGYEFDFRREADAMERIRLFLYSKGKKSPVQVPRLIRNMVTRKDILKSQKT
ncbi:hypothetical protein POM88_038846 [Heracleum sosnowskyi]|uniref:SANT domain-containing protein n=1 Tax=Heracleum sosnowskyi TaxID=360622 RepID=A0AAD8M5X1_9APIA|nr:hypothetical protein POM88_038846 [Heracleum sosnowskyi]